MIAMKIERGEQLFTVAGLLSHAECQALVDRGEAAGFEPAEVQMRSGRQMRTDIRNNDRVVLEDPELADGVWRRLRHHLPCPLEGAIPVGIEAAFRFYRYDPGQRFNRHRDGCIERSPTVRTRLTCLLYLNTGFEGGETVFYESVAVEGERAVHASVRPEMGMALLFRHDWWHAGAPVLAGRKYVLRTDVFYDERS
jgi:predicted 2-oxoglutarate/Fe(II)-dependent dioxygenase YbiX